jgi:DNA-binding NarL/FixJ family response regulator
MVGCMALTCLIVDDSAAFRRVAREFLEEEGIHVVGIATTGADAVAGARQLRPDVALVDVDLGGENGFAVARRLAEENGDVTLILISSHAEDEFAELIDASPAIGFVAKSELGAEAIEALLAR